MNDALLTVKCRVFKIFLKSFFTGVIDSTLGQYCLWPQGADSRVGVAGAWVVGTVSESGRL